MKEFNLKKVMKAYGDWRDAIWRGDDRDDVLEAEAAFKDEAAKVKLIVDAAEGKAKERCIGVVDIIDALVEVEKILSIPKAAMDGIEVVVNRHAHKFPNAYQYVPNGTVFSAKYRRDHWALLSVWRGDCNKSECYTVFHAQESRDAIIKRFTRW